MTRPSPKDVTLEKFCEIALAKAVEVSGKRDLKWTRGDGLWRFPCPLAGRGHTWTGTDPQAWVAIVDGDIKCGCRVCTPKPTTNGADVEAAYQADLLAYTEAVKAAIGWDDEGNVERANFGWDELRYHDYESADGAYLLRHRKIRKRHGNAEPQWTFQIKLNEPGDEPNYLNTWRSCLPTEWLAKAYPGMYQHYYNAIHVYRHGAFAARTTYCPVVCEGEKDAETFARLMTAVGMPDLIPTALPDQQPTVLAPHQLDVFRGREVVVLPDNDDGGRKFAEKWSAVLWGVADQQKVVDVAFFGVKVLEKGKLKGTEKGRDLTEWVEACGHRTDVEIGRELLAALAATPVLMEPLARPDAWRQKMSHGAKGGARDSAANAAVVITHHPEITGRVRRNTRSGEVEIVDPPWGLGVVAGSRAIANQLSIWLEQTDKDRLHLSLKSFEDALHAVPPPHDPLAHLLAVEWDRTPRLDALFDRYLPLGVGTNLSLALARVFMGDLARKLRGELVAQRLLVAIETDLPLDVAGAMAGRHGAQHRGRVTERQVEHFTRTEAAVVQTSMEVVANRQASLSSLPVLFAPSVWHVPSRSYVPGPLFLAVGSEPGDDRTEAKIDDRVFDYELDGAPLLEALAADFPQMIAEAVARVDELALVKVPAKIKPTTASSKRKLEDLQFMGDGLLAYVTKEVEGVDVSNPRALAAAHDRDEPMRYVIRKRFIDVLNNHLRQMYRDRGQMERAFNSFCGNMGWEKQTVLTQKIGNFLNVDMDGKEQRTFRGTLVSPERLVALKEFLAPSGPPPKGGGPAEPGGGPPSGDDFLLSESLLNGVDKSGAAGTLEKSTPDGSFSAFLEALTHERNDSNRGIESIPHVRASRVVTKKERGPRYLEGAAAIAGVRAILSKPGAVGLDFETWPTDPAWHAEQAAASAPQGEKGAAREQAMLAARLNARAHKRQACTVQLCHEDGSEVFARLTDPHRELPEMFEPVIGAAPWDDPPTLVAHNAQFEVEVLLNHGVALDVECTMIAAKCLLLVAVAEGRPQPVEFSLAARVAEDLERVRDKSVRDRDWRLEASLDDEGVAYGLQDARDALGLWRVYRPRLEEERLLEGYQVMRGALLPTAAANMAGLPLDTDAHGRLMWSLEVEAAGIRKELDRLCDRRIVNHGSTPQVSTWIMEEVLDERITPLKVPKVTGLLAFLQKRGGLKPDPGGGLKARLEKRHFRARGMSLHDATRAAQEGGYIGLDRTTMGEHASNASEDELLAAIGRELSGKRVLPQDQQDAWDAYSDDLEDWTAKHRDDAWADRFTTKLRALTSVGLPNGGWSAGVRWRRTKTGHLMISKGSKLRKAEQLKGVGDAACSRVAAYLVKHAHWTRATKLLDSFGKTLRRWVDKEDGHVRGQARVFAAWTGRQSCVDPNLQNQPREEEFRALWVAKPGRKLVIADYSQIELRLLAITAGDERLREVYREGRDVHQETADIAGIERKKAKNVNFALCYGAGTAGLCEQFGFELDEAARIMGAVLGAYEGLARFRSEAPREAEEKGFITIRPDRRVLYKPELSAGTQAINAPIQGSAASVQMRALRLTWDALHTSGIDARLAVSVHDEIILDAAEGCTAEAAEILVDCMTQALVEIYPESSDMGLARLTVAAVVDTWAQKP